MSDKQQLRKQLKTVRSSFRGEMRERADGIILKKFIKNFGAYGSFFIYNSFSHESGTKLIINFLLKEGKRVYLPRVEGDNIVAVPYGQTRVGAFGIQEPEGQAFSGDIDVTVIPLLGVNGGLFRIGYGGGFYDRYLKDRRTVKVGLGYSFQMLDFIEDEWDIPLDYFLCEEDLYGK